MLPELADGGRWTVENEGFGWKVRRLWDKAGTTDSTRYFSLRWSTWDKMKETYDSTTIRNILAGKVGDKHGKLAADTNARSA